MLRRQALSLSALLLASPLMAQSRPQTHENAAPPGTTDQSAALAQDLKRMRSLLQQMQTNLTYLPAGYSSMKHQFELEIDLWRILLDQMERTGQSVTPAAAPGPRGAQSTSPSRRMPSRISLSVMRE